MEEDFSGYATKAGLKCTDGRTIAPDAFKHQDKLQVPLVWQHGHSDPENVLGHAVLENRPDGVYAYGYFNDTPKAKHTRSLLVHKDINMMSIWANDLVQRAGLVLHGAIREVSLVLSGANPGALIENVTIRHSDGDEETLNDEAIIYTGLTLEHSSASDDKSDDQDEKKEETSSSSELKDGDTKLADIQHADDDETVQDVYDSMTDKQKQILHYMVDQALQGNDDGQDDNKDDAEHSNLDDKSDDTTKGSTVKHNVFETKDDEKDTSSVLSHDAMVGIIEEAKKGGSLKDVVEGYALAHGITDIDQMFPDAVALDKTPEFLKRRTEWVAKVLGDSRKSPFSRIKTLSADLTEEQARAKGYITGTLKKEEFFTVSKRVTTPTTVYKKQKLDRDDMIDITDFDVVAWLKSEMRLMLDEEVARAILIGDGRDISDEDKINEQNIRPIAKEHELYATKLYVNLDDANSSIMELVDQLVANRWKYKGTGTPVMFTTESVISRFLLLRDTLGRRIYKTLDELAAELRVSEIIPVEVMEEDDTVVAILVNMNDYVVGATAGGQVSMFDDFDIDYNQYKYLIETRCCGALTRLKSAIVVLKTDGDNVLVSPAAPTFDAEESEVTVVNTTGVVYKNADTDAVVNAAGSPYSVADGVTLRIVATPAAGYYFASSDDDTWSFLGNGN